MTTIRPRLKRCAVCKAEAEYDMVCSYTTSGCMMDTRPIFLGMNPLRFVDRCRCGYVAFDISSKTEVKKEDLESPEYQSIIKEDTAVSRYAAIAFLCSLQGNHSSSAYAYLRAAWMADDEGDDNASRDMRRKFLEKISETDRKAEDDMVRADVLRCLGMFEQAEEALDLVRKKDEDGKLDRVIEKEKSLISERNSNPSFF